MLQQGQLEYSQLILAGIFKLSHYNINMPIHRGIDKNGTYYQWGTQKKYYYEPGNKKSRNIAYRKALKQAQAIYSSGYKSN